MTSTSLLTLQSTSQLVWHINFISVVLKKIKIKKNKILISPILFLPIIQDSHTLIVFHLYFRVYCIP